MEKEDAAHWVAVYDELIGTCRALLGDGPGALRRDQEDTSHLAARLEEFEERRAYWLQRLPDEETQPE